MDNVINLIVDYFDSDAIERDSISYIINDVESSLQNDISPILQEMLKADNLTNMNINAIKGIEACNRVNKKKYTTVDKYIKNLITINKNIVKLIKDIRKIIDDEFKMVVIKENLNTRQIAVLGVVLKMDQYSNYMVDYIRYIIHDINLSKYSNSDFLATSEAVMFEIQKEISNFCRIVRFFNDNNNIISDINHIDKDIVTKANDTGITPNGISQFNKLLGSTGFIGNPIYHFKRWRADVYHNKMEGKKEKLIELNLRVNKLKQQSANGEDYNPMLDREIVSIQNRINKIENELRDAGYAQRTY